jgi:cytochrome c biogenesis protein CcmG, thiol:disulfide interchange protein DsbE
VLFLVGGIAIVAVLATRPIGPGTLPAAEAEGFYTVGSAQEGLRIGDRAPELAATVGGGTVTPELLTGGNLAPESLDGHGVWLVFGATWCTPCREEAPAIQEAHARFGQQGLTIMSLNVHEHAEVVRSFARDAGLTYPMALDRTGAIAQRFGVYGYPTHYFIGPDGIVRARHLGPLTSAQIEERLTSILP